MGGMSIWHWLILLVVVLVIFGTKKLRNLGEDLGGAVKGFKEGMKDASEPESTSAQSARALDKTTIDVEAKEKNHV